MDGIQRLGLVINEVLTHVPVPPLAYIVLDSKLVFGGEGAAVLSGVDGEGDRYVAAPRSLLDVLPEKIELRHVDVMMGYPLVRREDLPPDWPKVGRWG